MRRTVEVKVRVDSWIIQSICNDPEDIAYCEGLAMQKVRKALKDYPWFQDADEAEVVDE